MTDFLCFDDKKITDHGVRRKLQPKFEYNEEKYTLLNFCCQHMELFIGIKS